MRSARTHKVTVLRTWILSQMRHSRGLFVEQVSSRLPSTCSRISGPHQLLPPPSLGTCFPPNLSCPSAAGPQFPETSPSPGPTKRPQTVAPQSVIPGPASSRSAEASRRQRLLLQVTVYTKPAPTSNLTTNPAAPRSGSLQSTPDTGRSHPSAAASPGHIPKSAPRDARLVPPAVPGAGETHRQRQISPGRPPLLHYRSSCMPSHVLASVLVRLPHGVCLCLTSEKTSARCLLPH